MIDPNNDADMLTREFEDAARTVANGVCLICEEALDPTAPRWAGVIDADAAVSIVKCYGPPSVDDPTIHQGCAEWRAREVIEFEAEPWEWEAEGWWR